MAEKKKPFNAAYTQEVDKMIEEGASGPFRIKALKHSHLFYARIFPRLLQAT